VLLRGKEYVYPLEMMQVLTGVSPLLSARIVFDYLTATLKSAFAPARQEHSFEEWGVRNLGRTLYDLCFGIYSARVWGLPTSQISSKQAQRVAKLNLKNIILRTLGIKADPATYFTKYMYPRQGISLYEGMAAEVRARQRSLSRVARRAAWARRRSRRPGGIDAGRERSSATSCCRRCRGAGGMITPPAGRVAAHPKLRYAA
jgi:protoporphyrinogen oxidase